MPLISLTTISGTPVFVVAETNPIYERVHASVFDSDEKRWLFPAYPPFGLLVVNDLKKVALNATWSPEALAQIALLKDVPKKLEERTLPENFTFATKPFDHQIEGVTYLYHYPRFALYWDPGTGKTKVFVDLKRCHPTKRMLVLTPKVTVQNWVREIKIHSNDTIKAVALVGTPEHKRALVRRYKEYDVMVASYGTARTIGFPRLYPDTLEALKEAKELKVPLSDSGLATLVRGLRVLSDPERQLHLALAWALGTPIAQVCRYAAAEAQLAPQWLCDTEYQIITGDESHNLNNISAQQTKVAIGLAKQAPFRYLASGTPTLGDPRHLYPQMKFLSPAIFPEDWLKFSDMFLVRSQWNRRIVTGFQNLNILNERVQRIATRKKKEDCLTLPPRTIIDIPISLSAEQKNLYNTLVTDMSVELSDYFQSIGEKSGVLSIQNAAVLLNKLAQVTSGFVIDNKRDTSICDQCPHLVKCVDASIQPYTNRCVVVQKPPDNVVNFLRENPKLDALGELLESILAEDRHKVIIWANFHAELDTIEETLQNKNIGYVRVDGSTGGNLQDRIDEFNTKKDCRVYLGQVATGVGITLNAAQYMIYLSIPWSLGQYLQSIDRNYRAGQTEKVIVYRLLAEQTVDRYKALALDEKKEISTILTSKLACAICERQETCLKNNVTLFDPACMYQRKVTRTIAKAGLIT